MLFGVSVNWLAMVVCAIASLVIGGIWYGPLFGKPFRVAMGMDNLDPVKLAEMKKQMYPMYTAQFIASLITAVALAVFIGKTGNVDVTHGVKVAVAAWFGFIVPIQFGNSLWGGKRVLFYLGAGNMLVTMVVFGAILGVWH